MVMTTVLATAYPSNYDRQESKDPRIKYRVLIVKFSLITKPKRNKHDEKKKKLTMVFARRRRSLLRVQVMHFLDL